MLNFAETATKHFYWMWRHTGSYRNVKQPRLELNRWFIRCRKKHWRIWRTSEATRASCIYRPNYKLPTVPFWTGLSRFQTWCPVSRANPKRDADVLLFNGTQCFGPMFGLFIGQAGIWHTHKPATDWCFDLLGQSRLHKLCVINSDRVVSADERRFHVRRAATENTYRPARGTFMGSTESNGTSATW